MLLLSVRWCVVRSMQCGAEGRGEGAVSRQSLPCRPVCVTRRGLKITCTICVTCFGRVLARVATMMSVSSMMCTPPESADSLVPPGLVGWWLFVSLVVPEVVLSFTLFACLLVHKGVGASRSPLPASLSAHVDGAHFGSVTTACVSFLRDCPVCTGSHMQLHFKLSCSGHLTTTTSSIVSSPGMLHFLE